MSSPTFALSTPAHPTEPRPGPAALPHAERSEALPAALLRVSSRALLGGQREIEIDHEGVLYRLRQTSLGKLILTK